MLEHRPRCSLCLHSVDWTRPLHRASLSLLLEYISLLCEYLMGKYLEKEVDLHICIDMQFPWNFCLSCDLLALHRQGMILCWYNAHAVCSFLIKTSSQLICMLSTWLVSSRFNLSQKCFSIAALNSVVCYLVTKGISSQVQKCEAGLRDGYKRNRRGQKIVREGRAEENKGKSILVWQRPAQKMKDPATALVNHHTPDYSSIFKSSFLYLPYVCTHTHVTPPALFAPHFSAANLDGLTSDTRLPGVNPVFMSVALQCRAKSLWMRGEQKLTLNLQPSLGERGRVLHLMSKLLPYSYKFASYAENQRPPRES